MEHVIVKHVPIDVLLNLCSEVGRNVFTLEGRPHRVVQDRRHRRLDALDRLFTILVQRRAGREPDVDLGWIATRLTGSGVDSSDTVFDHIRQEPGAGYDPVADSPTQVQHPRTFGADRDGNALAHRAGRPADPLRAALIRRLACRQQIAHARDVFLDTSARGDFVADVENRAIAAGHVHEGPAAGQAVDGSEKGRHDLGFARDRVRGTQTDASAGRCDRYYRGSHKRIAADEGSIVGTDSLRAVVLSHLYEVAEPAGIFPAKKWSAGSDVDSEGDFHVFLTPS